jgi:hypothetical protein
MVLIDVFESRYVFFLNGTLSDLVSSGFFPSRSKKVVFSLELLNLYRNLLLTGFLSIAGFIQTIKKLQPDWKFPAEVESLKTYLISSCFKAHFGIQSRNVLYLREILSTSLDIADNQSTTLEMDGRNEDSGVDAFGNDDSTNNTLF